MTTNKFLQLTLIVLGLLLPLAPLAANPMHHDEALYAYWASLIAGGQDVMLNSVPIDKPPLFIYLVALSFKLLGISDTAARIPSLLATAISLVFTAALGQTLYNRRVGLLAMLLAALSPFSILFAATALTDPLLTAWVMASAWGAARAKPIHAGLGLALAIATKQQGVFFIPLTLGLLITAQCSLQQTQGTFFLRSSLKAMGICLLTAAPGVLLPLLWDGARTWQTGFWQQSSLSYGPVGFGGWQFTDRLARFIELLQFATASSALNILFAIGLPLLLIIALVYRRQPTPHRHTDWLLATFCAAFVTLHALFTFQIWDRYLLGLIPLLAILLARILLLPLIFIESPHHKTVPTVITATAFTLALSLMLVPAQQAVQSQYPIGGDHGAYTGAKEVSAYLRGHAGSGVTLYHHWLGAHWQYYLFGFPYDLRYWQTETDLTSQAAANRQSEQYIAFPAWQSVTPTRIALQQNGLTLQPVFKTYQPNGSPAIFLYRIVNRE